MDVATLTAAMLATLLLVATMMVSPAVAQDYAHVNPGTPAQLSTPDGGPGQFANAETVDTTSSDELISGIGREFRTENKTVGMDTANTGNTDMATSPRNADIVMTGGGPGESSSPFEFHLENINQ